MIDKVLEDCRKAHVQINHEKSHLSPSRQLEKHLGFTLDFAGSGTITVPQDRWDRLRQDIETLLRAAELHRKVPARLVASTAGQIISMGLAIGDVSRLFTRSLYRDIDSAPSWNGHVHLSTESVKELHFWSKTARTKFTSNICPVTDQGEAIHLASDASNIG